LAEFRCNRCVHLKQDYCSKLEEQVPNRLAKLFYGGAVGIYSGTVTYPSLCGIEKEQGHDTIVELEMFVPAIATQEVPSTTRKKKRK